VLNIQYRFVKNAALNEFAKSLSGVEYPKIIIYHQGQWANQTCFVEKLPMKLLKQKSSVLEIDVR